MIILITILIIIIISFKDKCSSITVLFVRGFTNPPF